MRNPHEFIPKGSYRGLAAAGYAACMDEGGDLNDGDPGSARDYAYFAFALIALIILMVTGLHP